MSKRIEWIDIAKGIGIILVVIGHLGTFFTLNNIYYPIMVVIIFTFHMPLFFFLSGLTLKIYNTKYPIIEITKRRFVSLIKPFVIGCIIYWAYFTILDIKHNSYKIDSIFNYLVKPLFIEGNFLGGWFLPCLFIATIITTILILLCKNNKNYLLAFATGLSAIGMVSPILFPTSLMNYVHTFYHFDTALVASFFITIAYLFKHHQFRNRLIFMVSCIVLIFCFYINSKVDMNISRYNNEIFFLLGGISGTYIIIFISRIIEYSQKAKLYLSVIGSNSLWIYIFHGLIIYRTKKIMSLLIYSNYLIVPLCVLFSLLVPIIFSIAIKKFHNIYPN